MTTTVLPSLDEEDRLLALARNGDQCAVTQIYDTYAPPIYQFVRLRVDDEPTAKDITSQVFAKFICALRGPNAPHKSLRGWLFRVARNELTDAFRQDEPLPLDTIDQWPASPLDHCPELRTIQNIEVARARQALVMLAPAQREVLFLRFDQQLSLKETSAIMDKNVNAVKALQFRAVNTLRMILEEAQQ